MMKAPRCLGGESALMSGMSPTQRAPFHWMPTRCASHGLPSASADARLYMMRRLAGQLKAHWWNMPRPLGSALLRRWAMLPASVKTPECSQLPHIVEPSSRSSANPFTCWPAGRRIFVGSLSSWTSASAQPFISLSASPRSGLLGFEYDQDMLRIGSGSAPPSLRYRSRTAMKSLATIS